MNNLTQTRIDAIKTAFKNVIHKADEVTGEFIGHKILLNSENKMCTCVPDKNLRYVEEIVISPEEREEVLDN